MLVVSTREEVKEMDYSEALLKLVVEAERQGFTVIPALVAGPDGATLPGLVFTRDDESVVMRSGPRDLGEWWALVLALIDAGLEWPPLPERN
jgi:hypothetical protein